MFLDPDDYYEDNACEILYKKAKKYNSDIAICNLNYLYSNGKKEKANFLKMIDNEYLIECIDDLPELISLPPAIVAKIFKREFIIENNIKFPEKIPGQDLVFYINSIFIAKKMLISNDIVYNYRIRDEEDKSISFNCDTNYFIGINNAQK